MGKILAVPSGLFKDLPTDTLIQNPHVVKRVMDTIIGHKMFIEREHLEDPKDKEKVNREFRQPIPYVLIEKAEDCGGEYVLMQRGKGQGEQRLWGKYCIGAGGHVEEGDTIVRTAEKEVKEELGLTLSHLIEHGIIISTGGPVEDVHIGIFYKATAIKGNGIFSSEELADQNPQWVNWRNLGKYYDNMEKWSQIVMRGFFDYKPAEAVVS